MKAATSIAVLAIIVAGVALAARPGKGAAAVADETPGLLDIPHLTVQGHAQLEKPADELRINIGVITEDEEATRALAENSARMTAVIDALTKVGLTKDEYRTGRFQVQPQYSRRPRQAESDWQPRVVGYRVNNTLHVETRKLDLAGDFIGAANRAGANSIDSISFGLADPRTHRAEAIEQATRHARADAQTLAAAAGLELGRVLMINLDGDRPMPRPQTYDYARTAMAAEAVTPPIEAGDVTINAHVSIVYEIKQ